MVRIFLIGAAFDSDLIAELISSGDLWVVGRAVAPGDGTLARLGVADPDVVVIDAADGTDPTLVLAVRARTSRARTAVVLDPDAGDVIDYLAMGVGAVVVRSSDDRPEVGRLERAIRTMITGGVFLDPMIAGRLVRLATTGGRAKGPFGLTLQEMRVLELLPRGFTNKEIGRELGVSAQTVKSHLGSAMRKLQVRDRVEAAAMARETGLL
jgi:DNA-binding NarL/FixJ family response regulator